MPAIIFLGWIVGIIFGVVVVILPFIALGLALPAFLSPFTAFLTPIIALLAPWLAIAMSILILVATYIVAYLIATTSIAPLLPGLTGVPTLAFPLARRQATPAGVGVIVPATAREFLARGVMIGLTAIVNSLLMSLVPGIGPFLAAWVFTVISLGAIIAVARNVFYQGFLAWTAWLLPVSYIATGVGLLLFVVNLPFALVMTGIGAFRIDWTTGVIETATGLPAIVAGITGAAFAGFSLGNFNFLVALPTPGDFLTPSVSSHETGHTLNTAAFGGIVLWINAVDENITPKRLNLAYGELTAQSHANNLGPDMNDYSLRLWS